MHDQEVKKLQSATLRGLVMSMYDIQHTRVILGNRFDVDPNTNVTYQFIKDLETAEKNVKESIKTSVVQYPIHEWIISQKGISYDMAGQMIGLIEDIGKFDNISKLWAYSGMGTMQVCEKCGKRYLPFNDKPKWILKTAQRLMEQYERKIVKDGESGFDKKAAAMLCSCDEPKPRTVAQRKIKGALLDYNPKLKSLCWRFGKQFVMQGDFYRKLYDQFRAEYEVREDLVAEMNSKAGNKSKHGVSKGSGHIHNMAQRKTVKIFLSHLWLKWREADGLTVTAPYIIGVGGHSKYIAPPD